MISGRQHYKGSCSLHGLKTASMLQGSQHDLSTLEAAVDSLLTDVTAEDPFSLSMHHYVRFMQLLQWALQCIWSLHSRDAALLAATTAACQTASAFTQALQQYAKAVHADLHAVAQNNISTAGPASEPLRIKLRPTRKMADSAYKQLQVCQHNCTSRIVLPMACIWAILCALLCPVLYVMHLHRRFV